MHSTEMLSTTGCVSHGRPRKRWYCWRLILVAGALAAVMSVGFEACRVVFGSNIHVAVAGKLYRGAQPTAADLEALAARYHIRTVVNLRGPCDPADWFVEEIKATERLQMSQEDICMASGRLPSDQELRKLVDVFDHAEYPLFLHCRRGADRTGMAAAVYMLLETDATLGEARTQLGLRYGHVAVGQTCRMDQFLDLYTAWLRAQNREHSRSRFRHWILNEYHGAGFDYRIERFIRATDPLKARQPMGFQVRVRNTGKKSWQFRPVETGGFKLGFCLRDGKDIEVTKGFAGLFDAEVNPGEFIDFAVVVPAVARAGRYRLTLDMVHPEYVWLFQLGSEPLEEELIIRE
jgi:protein tyrosine phosphatase (PTP) superfamily phosphohydrolase (DUF442 family)